MERVNKAGCEHQVLKASQLKLLPTVYHFTDRYFDDLDMEKISFRKTPKTDSFTIFWLPLLIPGQDLQKELMNWPNLMLKRYCELSDGQYQQAHSDITLPPTEIIHWKCFGQMPN